MTNGYYEFEVDNKVLDCRNEVHFEKLLLCVFRGKYSNVNLMGDDSCRHCK